MVGSGEEFSLPREEAEYRPKNGSEKPGPVSCCGSGAERIELRKKKRSIEEKDCPKQRGE